MKRNSTSRRIPHSYWRYGLTFDDLVEALPKNNANVGAGYIEKNGEQYLIRAPGQIADVAAIERVIVTYHDAVPVTIADVAEVGFGKQLRTGAATLDGEETVLGTAVMLLGANSRTVSEAVSEKLAEINKTLPEGVIAAPGVRPYGAGGQNHCHGTDQPAGRRCPGGGRAVVDARQCSRCIAHGDGHSPVHAHVDHRAWWRPNVSANLMSLGALDFGLIVDGAVIIVENCILRLGGRQHRLGRILTLDERFQTVFTATREVFTPSLVSVLVVFW